MDYQNQTEPNQKCKSWEMRLSHPQKDGLEYALIIRNQTYDHKAKTASNNEPA